MKKTLILDINTEDLGLLHHINTMILCHEGQIKKEIKRKGGWTYITNRFDASFVCQLKEVVYVPE